LRFLADASWYARPLVVKTASWSPMHAFEITNWISGSVACAPSNSSSSGPAIVLEHPDQRAAIASVAKR
jgi:hypothetical protein